ncbi:hypothetical protein Tco_0317941 [Tanacetum coccineum]
MTGISQRHYLRQVIPFLVEVSEFEPRYSIASIVLGWNLLVFFLCRGLPNAKSLASPHQFQRQVHREAISSDSASGNLSSPSKNALSRWGGSSLSSTRGGHQRIVIASQVLVFPSYRIILFLIWEGEVVGSVQIASRSSDAPYRDPDMVGINILMKLGSSSRASNELLHVIIRIEGGEVFPPIEIVMVLFALGILKEDNHEVA